MVGSPDEEVPMPFSERVSSYTVTELHNDIVDYDQVVRLLLDDGEHVFIAFPTTPPQDWLRFGQGTTTVFLQRAEFDRVHRLLQPEAPLFVTAFNLIGIRAFNLSSDQEPLGEGPADHDALVGLMQRYRASTP